MDFGEPGQTMQVLVVEDEQRLRDLLLRAVPEMGLEGTGARSAEEALKLMEQEPAQIIVLDLNLPGMSGLEFFEKVREQWPRTQVVILTGFGDLDAAKQAIHLDVVEFLTKPCTLGDLEVALDRARKRYEQAGAETKPALAYLERLRRQREQGEAEGDEGDEQTQGQEGSGTEEDEHAQTLQEIERKHILEALARNEGNRQATAKELGISVRTLYYRIAEYQKQGYLD